MFAETEVKSRFKEMYSPTEQRLVWDSESNAEELISLVREAKLLTSSINNPELRAHCFNQFNQTIDKQEWSFNNSKYDSILEHFRTDLRQCIGIDL